MYAHSPCQQNWEHSSCCFFFSSRRRHTRFDCDWSSDVCSSDLEQDEKDRQFLEAVRQGADGVPRRPGISQRQEKENTTSQPPKLALPLFEPLEARGDDGTRVRAW